MTKERALDKERVRFLRAMDEVAPQVWKEVESAGESVDLKGWARRHHLPSWAAEYASERLRFDSWIELFRVRIPELDQTTRSPPLYDPQIINAKTFQRKVQLYMARVEQEARKAGVEPTVHADVHHLRWLARWQVLQQSPEHIAAEELQLPLPIQAGSRAAQRLKNRASEVRKTAKALAKKLVLSARARGQVGRPPRRKTPG